MLEKTLESPLDFKEIKPVSHKGNQLWIFLGRTDDKTEAPILWPADSLEKTLMLGKTEDRRRRRRQSMKRLDGISNLMDMSLSKVGDRKVWHAAVHGVTKSWTRLSDWTELKFIFLCSDGQSCLTLCDPMECIPLDSSVHGILQTRVLEWGYPFIRLC